ARARGCVNYFGPRRNHTCQGVHADLCSGPEVNRFSQGFAAGSRQPDGSGCVADERKIPRLFPVAEDDQRPARSGPEKKLRNHFTARSRPMASRAIDVERPENDYRQSEAEEK